MPTITIMIPVVKIVRFINKYYTVSRKVKLFPEGAVSRFLFLSRRLANNLVVDVDDVEDFKHNVKILAFIIITLLKKFDKLKNIQ